MFKRHPRLRSFSTALACFTGGKMNDAHCAVGRVDALAPGPSRSERVDAEILWIDVDVKLRARGDNIF